MSTVDTRSTGVRPANATASGGTARDTSIEPVLVRVSVVGGDTQLDVGLPAAIPVAVFMPDLVAQIGSRAPTHHGYGQPDDGTRATDDAGRWTLALVGHDQIAPHRSLAESGIRDGDLLVLRSVRTSESPEMFDDVLDAVARLNESRFASWSPRAARHVGHVVAVLAAVAAAVGLCAYRWTRDGVWPAGLGAIVAVALVAAATIVARHHRDTATATVLAASSTPLAFVAGMLLVPGCFGAAHLVLGCAVALVSVVLSHRLTAVGTALHTASAAAMLLGGMGAAAVMLLGAPVADVSAVVAATGVLVIALAPRATIVLARLPLPPVPTAGARIETTMDDSAPDIEGIGAVGAIALPKADALERRSFVANAYLTGIVAGTTAVTAIGAMLAAAPQAGFDAKAAAFAVVVGAVLCLRGRSHSDLGQASVLIGGGAAIALALTAELAFGPGSRPIPAFVFGMVILVAALVFGVLAPATEFSPVMRRAAEIVEYLLVAVIVPLLLWLLDLYRIVREI
ncbi:type VII secretion integral membrane protein EccD [Gordonia sp. NPDC003424]